MLKNCVISGFADEIHPQLDVQMEVLKELGQKYIELRAADGTGIADMSMEQAKGIRERLERQDIRVSALGSPIGKIGIGEDFEPHFARFQHVAELAELFGTKNIRMFSFYLPVEAEPEAFRDEVMRRMGRLVDYAALKGLVLLHENEKGIYGDNALRCEDLMKTFYGENFKCTFDFANFVQCSQDTGEAYDLLKPYISYLHIKDALAENGRVVPAGEGDGHVREILRDLERSGYEGFLSLEPHLSDFPGLEKLEREKSGRGTMRGGEAYRYAHQKFMKLLAE